MLKIGDKVKILNIESPIIVYSTDVGDIVEVIHITHDENIYYKNNNGNIQEINPKQVELVCGKDSSKFKIGDKVRLNTNEVSSDYYYIIPTMIEDYDVLTIAGIYDSSYGEDGSYIMVQENPFNYHSDWLELVDEQEEIGYTTITGVHFGDFGEYTWICDRELFEDIKLLDLVLVDTKLGEQVVQVIKKSEVLNVGHIHRKVIRKLKITSK